MSSADTRTRAIEALDRACSLPPAAGMDGEQVGGGRVLLTYEEAVDALLVAGWRPPADDAAVERAALAAAADDLKGVWAGGGDQRIDKADAVLSALGIPADATVDDVRVHRPVARLPGELALDLTRPARRATFHAVTRRAPAPG